MGTINNKIIEPKTQLLVLGKPVKTELEVKAHKRPRVSINSVVKDWGNPMAQANKKNKSA